MDDILRLEARYAALLFADLRSPTNVRKRLLTVIEEIEERSIGCYEAAYVEPAPFRDKWKSLKSEDRRRALVRELVLWADCSVDSKLVEGMVDSRGYIRSPASWNTSEISELSKKLFGCSGCLERGQTSWL
ncbi:MAG: hypothetical protein WB524_05905 [Acidobacteriaceae bacterium]